ncbi:hypothetical protein [Pandoraea commovens]|uniref:Uncharacterized protein n=1 Tax=Pandoraea commovens TaxID=2508289 RepID=A0ABY5QAS2_9BURK|nr:hypothetical protein [Pandoraea commovens]UVA77248.1 hypothetical protein NTU39_14045 [Pandoraea commovens]
MNGKPIARRNRDTLRRKFGNGEMPSATAFSELIDSMLNIVDEGFDKTPVDGLKVSQLNQGKLLSFYQNIDLKSPIWTIQLDSEAGGLAFGNPDNPNALTLRQLGKKPARDAVSGPPQGQGAQGAPATIPTFELDVAGRVVADGRRGRPGARSVQADGKWHDITDPLTGCQAFEITAGVGKRGSGKFALMHAYAVMAYNGKGDIDYRQSHFGSKCNRLQLQWVDAPDGAKHSYVLQMRVGCPYDSTRDAAGAPKTWVTYYLTTLWFDPDMTGSATDPEPKGAQ